MITRLRYILLKWLLATTARLPFWMLYRIADIIYIIIYHFAKYRREIVTKNIAESFPELSGKERNKIMRGFYRHFADYIVETIKINHISDKQMRRHMTFENIELVDSLIDKGRSVVAYFSHYGNWEWVTSITLWSRHAINGTAQYCQVYRPLKDRWFDNYFLKLRSRFNSISIKKRSVLRELITLRRNNTPSVTGFMSDQKPSGGDLSHVVKFLNHPTAVITGTETLARKLDMAVVYIDVEKIKRGHYHITLRLIAEDCSTMPELSVTDTYTRMLEHTIRRNPDIWLWSHNRWKNKVSFPSNDTRPNDH